MKRERKTSSLTSCERIE